MKRTTFIMAITAVFTGFANGLSDRAWYLDQLNVRPFHAEGITGKGITIGIVDCGEHGFGVKSIIASKEIGIAPDCTLVYRHSPDGIARTLDDIRYCATNGCRVINLSLGFNIITATPEQQKAFEDGVRAVAQAGVIIVCSNGNNEHNELVESPAVIPELIAIGGVKSDNSAAPLKANRRMDFCAYGIDVPMLRSKGGLRTDSGTSFAAPMATGIIALLLQQQPTLTRDEAYEILKRNVRKLADRKTKDFGWGLLQACRVPADYRRQGEIDAARAKRVPVRSVRLTNPELVWNEAEELYDLSLPAGGSIKLTYETSPSDATDPKIHWHCGNTVAVARILEDDVLRMKGRIATMKIGGTVHSMDRATIYAIDDACHRLATIRVTYRH